MEHLPHLVAVCLSNPEVFARSSAMRRSNEREQLRKKTGLSNEILEGWYIMFQRNPRKDHIIRKFTEAQAPQTQNTIPRIAYREDRGRSAEESSEASNEGSWPALGSAGAGRRGKQESGSGGRVIGADATRERAKKEKNKASRANHARKKQRDRKMNRGMGGGCPDGSAI
ncbi:MAG: hypothetical protein BJ554DRAFT_2641 [Olpidium bornovanus]|uniref:Uncharacterized protein n=1 Tax=Olpidium bornovanus TaxID=278681 RepID=A0A8H7ZQM8_9FUNG|nr:MAG: hypothetical protein BJ554DRAFT_2641 [Olpidium bornovanus]